MYNRHVHYNPFESFFFLLIEFLHRVGRGLSICWPLRLGKFRQINMCIARVIKGPFPVYGLYDYLSELRIVRAQYIGMLIGLFQMAP